VTSSAALVATDIPDLRATKITSGQLSVANGGTGISTFNSNGVLIGNGTGNLVSTATPSPDQILRVPGAGGQPSFGAIDLSKSASVGGILASANGGTGVNSTATFPTSGVVVTEAATATLTNKTLSGATINGASSIGGDTTINTTGSVASGAATIAGNVTIQGSGAAARRLVLNDAGNSKYLALQAPNTVTTTTTWTLPAADGGAGQVLATNGSGTLSWTSGLAPTGAASGDLIGSFPGPTVAMVGTSTAANVHSAELAANSATELNTASTIVKRDISGSFSAGTVTANLVGNVTGNVSGNAATSTSATSFTGPLAGDVTGTQGASVVAKVGGVTAAAIATGANLANAATNSNAASTLVARDASGNFSAGTITANLTGNVTGNVSGSAASVTGTVAVANGGTGVTTSTGTGSVVLSNSPTLVSPALGTPASGVATYLTGLPLTTGVTGTLGVSKGGTGTTANPASGQLLIGNGTDFTLSTLTAGSGVSIANTAGAITISATTASSTCPTGYILVPKDNKFSFKDFCVMKYEAKKDSTTGLPVSTAANSPFVSISWYEAKDVCQRVGAHLVTEGEWMTIARNIEATLINDIDAANGIQLATGHSDNAPANALVAATEGALTNCTLTSSLGDPANGSCSLRTDTNIYSGTGQSWAATGYVAGGSNKSQMRTHVLSNGNVIWDLSGNVWEWTDMQCTAANWNSNVGWLEWNNTGLTDWEKLVAGPNGALTSTNGAGQYYGCTAASAALLRGAYWSNGSLAGVFAVLLTDAPTGTGTNVGFRCALQP